MKTYPINHTPATKDFPRKPSEPFEHWLLRLIEEHGFHRRRLVGKIGNGTKLHTFRVTCRVTDKGLQIADIKAKCGCGISGHLRMNSKITLTDEAEANCHKCLHDFNKQCQKGRWV